MNLKYLWTSCSNKEADAFCINIDLNSYFSLSMTWLSHIIMWLIATTMRSLPYYVILNANKTCVVNVSWTVANIYSTKNRKKDTEDFTEHNEGGNINF